MPKIIQAACSALHEGLLQSTNLWQWLCLCWRVALADCHTNLHNFAESAWEGRLHLHATQSKGRAFGARGWAQAYVSRPRPPERFHESTCRACCGPGLGNLHWHSTPAQAEVVRNFPTTDRMFASRCGDNHEGAPIHGRHRHGQCGNSASCGNIACDTWTCLVEAPPCRLALSI